jgi:hypothetical protein
MRILCLILASDNAPEYIQFQSLWRKILHIDPNVDCYFYKGHPNLTQDSFLEDNTIWIKVPETLETVYEKTLKAFEFCIPMLDKYDFIYRSNLSTFVSFEHLISFCEDLPKFNCCAAVIGGLPPADEKRYSLNSKFTFPGGNGFILSPDLVKRLVVEKIPLVEQDDVTIGVALQKWQVPIIEFVRPDFHDDGHWFVNNFNLLKPHEHTLDPKKIMFTYRIKSFDRKKDVEVMRSLIEKLYGV